MVAYENDSSISKWRRGITALKKEDVWIKLPVTSCWYSNIITNLAGFDPHVMKL